MKKYSRLLQKYAQVMLPPAPEKGVVMPLFPMSKAPDVEAIQHEHLKKVDEMEKAKGEGEEAKALKMKHIDEMLQALEEGGEDAFFGTMKADDGILPPKEEMAPEYEEALFKMRPEKKKGPKFYSDLGLSPEEIAELAPTEEVELPSTTQDEGWKGLSLEEGTIRPGGKSASLETLLKKCDVYYKLTMK